MKKYPFYLQLNMMDCGPACLRMICKYYGKVIANAEIRKNCYVSRKGSSLWNLGQAASTFGFRTTLVRIDIDDLHEVNLPAVLYWKGRHFVVIYAAGKNKYTVADPSIGIVKYTREELTENWVNPEYGLGAALLLEPSPLFYQPEKDDDKKKKTGLRHFFPYFYPFKKYYVQIGLGMLASMSFSLVVPFLAQSVIDVGINNKDIGFISLIIMAQIMFSVSATLIGFIQSWIFLHTSSRINIALISDYILKLFKLPLSFFESRMLGDILQRIGDYSRVQGFLSSTTLSSVFSLVNLIVFSVVMCYYSIELLLLFLLFNALYIGWITVFLKKRREFDFKSFDRSAKRQTTMVELIQGVRDIKLHNVEDAKRWEWEKLQVQNFKITLKQTTLGQLQQGGSFIIETTKSFMITFISAKYVIEGNMSLGMMMSMQYILAQIGAPLYQLIGLINSYQDAKISLERIGEIQGEEEETEPGRLMMHDLPAGRSLTLKNIFFSYSGDPHESVLKDINLTIPEGKVTAIVGESGCGKTSLVKLLLKFYAPTKGKILLGSTDFANMDHSVWRRNCGAVMQDGFIFSDTIAGNIALGDEDVSMERLEEVCAVAKIQEFIHSLPNGYRTEIGDNGVGLSQGQKQRLLIARALYNDPEYLFLDEATNSLDSRNEFDIIEGLRSIFKGKTVVIIAHRLSTIMNADKILVLRDGVVMETGRHNELLDMKGEYYTLVNKQTALQTLEHA